jgi:hypothetical protein
MSEEVNERFILSTFPAGDDGVFRNGTIRAKVFKMDNGNPDILDIRFFDMPPDGYRSTKKGVRIPITFETINAIGCMAKELWDERGYGSVKEAERVLQEIAAGVE